MLFSRMGWLAKIHLLLHRTLFGLCVIDWILQGDALLLRGNLLLLLHLKFLMNLLSELHVKFGWVLRCDSWLNGWNGVRLVGPSWAASLAWHRWDIVYGNILLLRKGRLSRKIWGDWLTKRLFTNRLFPLIISHKNWAHCNCRPLHSVLGWVQRILLLWLRHTAPAHEVPTCGGDLYLLCVCRADIQGHLYDILVVIVNMHRRNFLPLILLHAIIVVPLTQLSLSGTEIHLDLLGLLLHTLVLALCQVAAILMSHLLVSL